MATNSTMPDLFANFGVVVQDRDAVTYRAIMAEPGDGGVPQDTVNMVQFLYDNNQKASLSFREGLDYFGKTGPDAANQFLADVKASIPHVTPRPEHKATGLSARVSIEGIVVNITSVVGKVGRKPGSKSNGN
jgi:hypothetical protein